MPTKTVNFHDEQYRYIIETAQDPSFSGRVRELVEKGMKVEGENDE